MLVYIIIIIYASFSKFFNSLSHSFPFPKVMFGSQKVSMEKILRKIIFSCLVII